MGNPIAVAEDFVAIIGLARNASDLVSGVDPDGPITKYRMRDRSAGAGYFRLNGVQQASNVWIEVDAADLNKAAYVAAGSIGNEQVDFQVYEGGDWSSVRSVMAYSAFNNTSRPVVTLTPIFGTTNEWVNMVNHISASDPDGWPIIRYQVRDMTVGAGSGKFRLNNSNQVEGQWFFVSAEDFEAGRLNYVPAANNQAEMYQVRAANGIGVQAFLWSMPVTSIANTQANENAPVVTGLSSQFLVNELVAAESMFFFSDADGNTAKKYSFRDNSFDATSSKLFVSGIEIAPGVWKEVSASRLDEVNFRVGSEAALDSFEVRVFDGSHWSQPGLMNIQAQPRPVITPGASGGYGLASDESGVTVIEDVVRTGFRSLFQEVNTGQPIQEYEVLDANTGFRSARLATGTVLHAQGVVHTFDRDSIDELEVQGGFFETSSTDDMYVRGFNGQVWTEWQRLTIQTEPEYIEGLLGEGLTNATWLDSLGGGDNVISYSFVDHYPTDGRGTGEATVDNSGSPIPIPMRDAMRHIFDEVNGMQTGVFFQEVHDASTNRFGQEGGVMRIGFYEQADTGVCAFAFFPGSEAANPSVGDIWFNGFSGCFSTGQFEDDGLERMVLIHELGHALGMKHNYRTLTPEFPLLPVANGVHMNSVMYTPGSRGDGLHPRTFGLYDTAAIQQNYGANMSTRSGDTVYDIGGYWDDANFVENVWDGGGIDTIDISASFTNDVVDLREGGRSWIGPASAPSGPGSNMFNMTIAYGAVIENATTGIGQNRIYGNEAANTLMSGDGADHLEGFGGSDLLMGGRGADTYYFQMADGDNIVNEDRSNGVDIIDVTGEFVGLDNFTEDVAFSRLGRDLIIDFRIDNGPSQGTVTIKDMQWGGSRVESLRLFNGGGVTVDLTSVFAQTSTPNQRFALSDPGTYGLTVVPV